MNMHFNYFALGPIEQDTLYQPQHARFADPYLVAMTIAKRAFLFSQVVTLPRLPVFGYYGYIGPYVLRHSKFITP